MVQTTSATIAQRKKAIPFSQLPRTFQEATSIIRRLGFRYLWIDSLCIIQDDEADWQRESAQMADIYAKAALTVAASGSQDSKGGCFRTTPELSGSSSWEIAVEYRALDDGAAESPGPGDSIDADRQSEDNRWLYDDEISAHWEQWTSGGQACSIFGASNERFSIMRYLPGQAPLASLPGKLSSSKSDTTKASEINENRDTDDRNRPGQTQKPPNFRGKLEILEHSTGVYVRELLHHHEFASNNFVLHPGKSPLSSRAWTLQERLLSTRILHFTASELVWECNTESCCQCGLVGRDTRIWETWSDPARTSARTLKLAFEQAVREASNGNQQQMKNVWKDFVQLYTNKLMSYKTDRLPAASGLIKRLQQANAGECFAGMWRKYLAEQMTWQIEAWMYEKMGHTRHETYVAPTWSWASVNVNVRLSEVLTGASILAMGLTLPEPNVVAEILDVQYSLAGLDPTGSLSDAILTIRAPVLPAELLVRRCEKRSFDRSEFAFLIRFPESRGEDRLIPDSLSDIDTSVTKQDVLCVQWATEVDPQQLVAQLRAVGWEGNFILNSHYLVLRQCAKRLDKYERIGVRHLQTRRLWPEYLPPNQQCKIDKLFQGACVRTLDLV